MIILDRNHLITINENIVAKENQRLDQEHMLTFGIKDEQLLTIVSKAPYEVDETGDFYIYKSMIDKATKLGCDITRKRPFNSCNIKTSIISMLTLLNLNNITLENYQNDLEELVAYLIEDGNYDDVHDWIENHSN